MEKRNTFLEVPENADHVKKQRVQTLLDPIRKLERPPILDKVSGFLPSLEKAQKDLEARMARGENVNVEDVSRGKYVEMEILKAREEGDEEHWTSDSDPDSPPSSDINDNDFTSDTDSDSSSSTCSSTSSSSASPPPRKRPLIQVLPDKKQTK
ncbi:uncharacterized protein [Lepeophtheirus salmonis]|uniref:uncharacterized protein n=1 Tax=Lepeophtheirus salmonis TaxID=72036 RepID=UPI001AE411D5|nr:uncharacterized protein C12orf45 homolog [Lepeophtheirus salmonis]